MSGFGTIEEQSNLLISLKPGDMIEHTWGDSYDAYSVNTIEGNLRPKQCFLILANDGFSIHCYKLWEIIPDDLILTTLHWPRTGTISRYTTKAFSREITMRTGKIRII